MSGATDQLYPELIQYAGGARRGVLFGDHRQLPPFLDSEVEQWGKTVGDQVTRDLMAKSALELLAGQLPDSHVAWLTRQRRMPSVIGDFVSTSFYDGRLRTCVRREHRDPVFRGHLALVDTAGLIDRYLERGIASAGQRRLAGRLFRAG